MHIGTHTTQFKGRDSLSECRQTPLLAASASSCSWWCPCIHHTQLSSPVCVSCKSTFVCRNRVCMYIWRPPEEPLVLVVGLSLLAQGDSALVASTILLGPDRLLFQSTDTLANTPECCGKTLLPMWEADCAAAQLCCFSIPSRGTVGNAKHPGPRQSILRTSYVGLQSALSPAYTMSSRDSLQHNA